MFRATCWIAAPRFWAGAVLLVAAIAAGASAPARADQIQRIDADLERLIAMAPPSAPLSGAPIARDQSRAASPLELAQACPPGQDATDDGYCLPMGHVYCGAGKSCNPGMRCGSGGGCIPMGAMDCGNGYYCPTGTTCAGPGRCRRY